jgi:hypothetical protein
MGPNPLDVPQAIAAVTSVGAVGRSSSGVSPATGASPEERPGELDPASGHAPSSSESSVSLTADRSTCDRGWRPPASCLGARFGHGANASVTARTLRSRCARYGHGAHASVTARTLQSRRARFGHGAHATVTARTLRSLRARFGHGAHSSVTARMLRPRRATARMPRSRRARFGHGAHASVTARTLRSRCSRFGHGVHVSIAGRTSRQLWTQQARRPRRRDFHSTCSGAGSEAVAGGGC